MRMHFAGAYLRMGWLAQWILDPGLAVGMTSGELLNMLRLLPCEHPLASEAVSLLFDTGSYINVSRSCGFDMINDDIGYISCAGRSFGLSVVDAFVACRETSFGT